MSDEDYETWVRGGVSPTLNAFDNATETRATVLAIGFYPTGGTHGVSAMDEVAPAVKVGSSVGIPSAPAVMSHQQVRRLTPVEVCRLQGFPDDWNIGLPDSARYKQMGNAVTVNVANYIATLINSAVRESA